MVCIMDGNSPGVFRIVGYSNVIYQGFKINKDRHNYRLKHWVLNQDIGHAQAIK